MQKTTPLFPGFHLQTLRRKPRSSQQKLVAQTTVAKQKTLAELKGCLGRFIPDGLLRPNENGAHSRNRIFNKENTFWAFFLQVLDADGGCAEVVRKLKAYASLKPSAKMSVSTGSYCKARAKLSEEELQEIYGHTVREMQRIDTDHPLVNRRVIVVDGTGVSMPDTEANQVVWPQQATQKPGCGFPYAKICACFSLGTGALLSYAVGSKHNHELTLLRRQLGAFKPGDIFLADKGFCSYFDMSNLLERGVDSVLTLARRTPVKDVGCLKKLSPDDLLVQWVKPDYWNKRSGYSREQWAALPRTLALRQIKVVVDRPGFRTKEFHIVTTLLDPIAYPASELASLYLRRWEAELFFRDIKTTMSMDVLRCKTPEMIRKELLMHFIVYNAIRRLIYEAAKRNGADRFRISFKGALQSLRQWEPHLSQGHLKRKERLHLIGILYDAITGHPVPLRPDRREPRCLKRRLKPYQLLSAPRHEIKEIAHRSQAYAK
jgi:hypothetical protein